MKTQNRFFQQSALCQIKIFLFLALTVFLLTASAFSAEVTLQWDPNTESDLAGYKIYYDIDSGAPYEGTGADQGGSPIVVALEDLVDPDHPQHTISGLAGSQNYHFAVTAYDNEIPSLESGFSDEVTVSTYTINSSAGQNGSVTPAGSVSLANGDNQIFTFTPNTGYHIDNVLVDGSSVGAVASYTFTNITANHTISATFAVNAFTITASAGSNGTISPSGSVTAAYGSSRTFTVTPNTGYHIANVLVDGSSVGAVASYTFSNITSDHSIVAIFAVNEYVITASAGSNGTISPSGSISAAYGSSRTFTVTPNTGYHIANVLVDGSSVGAVSSYAFTNIMASHAITATFEADNQPPFANAGPDQLVDEKSIVALSGLNSTDPDDGIASFSWTQIQGTPVVLSNPNEEETTFTAPDVSPDGETLVFQLMVEDYSGAQAIDTCIVNVSWVNMPPSANAGSNQTVNEGDTVVLNASGSSDPDDGIASFQWTQTEGVPVVLSDSRAIQPSFIAPNAGPEGTSLKFSLVITDQGGLQSSDTCIVNVSWINMPPTADAGPDQNANEGQTVVLDGSNSFDEDDGIASYQWVQTFGTPVALSDPTSDQPAFIAPDTDIDGETLRFQLTVIDTDGLQAQDECVVNVLMLNEPPIADAGPDQTAYEGDTVTLTGENSSDTNNNIESYQWIQISGTPVSLSGSTSVSPSFTAPAVTLEGESVTFQLTVTDSSGLQDTDTCIINVLSMHDDCPNDPDKVDPGVCGCGISDEDTDNDGTPDCIDNCPYDPNKTEPGVNGCGNTEPPPAGDSSVSDPEEGQTGIDSIQPDNGMNDNSIPDSDQANFTSLKLNTDQDYVTIESPQGTTLHCQNTSAIATEMLSASEGIQFPSGFFEFTVSGVQSGGSIAVILTLPSGSVVDTYYKYGKTPDNPMDHWYEFLYDGETGAEINENVITLHFVDGKRGDDDLDGTNGMIVDPGGPALLSSAIDRATESAGDETGSGGCFIGSFMN